VCCSNLLFLNQRKDSEIIQIPALDDEKNMWYFEKYLSAALRFYASRIKYGEG
jgi:hypothetical protein